MTSDTQHTANSAALAAARAGKGKTDSGLVPFLAGNAVLGTIGVFAHEAGTAPMTLTWFRCAFGLLGITLWLRYRRQLPALRLTRSTAPFVLLAGSLMVISWGLFFSAITRIPTGIAVVLFQIQPLWVLLLAAIFLNEAIRRRRVVSVSIAMIGLVLATGVLERFMLPGAGVAQAADYWWGVAACLAGALVTACVTILARRLKGMPQGVLAWWQCALGTLVLWVWPMQHGWPQLGVSWLWLAGLGLIHTGLAYTLLYQGMGRLPAGRIAVLQYVYPAVAIVVDWLYFGHALSPLQLAGILFMAMAIWIAERDRGI